ncbi:MAG TPA: SDR family oxidoreductase [Planctomycetota bacterium]|nr:SDR family oxidoreductase [Planctomycetota bacterium]
MRIAVIGGTGAVGRHAVDAVKRSGHEPVVVARSRGVDASTGAGLDAALAGVAAVVDVTSFQAADADAARRLFGGATKNLLAAGKRAGVKHHVLISIVGLDRIEGNAHYAGKREQEGLVSSGPIPWTIQRATQFHEFAAMVAEWTTRGDTALVPPALVQPIAAADVGAVLAEIAIGAPRGMAVDLAGPEPQDLFDMARRTLAARGASLRLVPSWRGGVYAAEAAGEVLLPAPNARLAKTTFDEWLAVEGKRR